MYKTVITLMTNDKFTYHQIAQLREMLSQFIFLSADEKIGIHPNQTSHVDTPFSDKGYLAVPLAHADGSSADVVVRKDVLDG